MLNDFDQISTIRSFDTKKKQRPTYQPEQIEM